MMRLKSRRKDAVQPGHHPGGMPKPTGVAIVDGKPVKPYELPDDPLGNTREMARMRAVHQRQSETQSTMFRRGATAVAEGIRRRKGRGFEVTLLRRYTLEFHRVPTTGGEKFRLELYRARRWDFNVELWRSR